MADVEWGGVQKPKSTRRHRKTSDQAVRLTKANNQPPKPTVTVVTAKENLLSARLNELSTKVADLLASKASWHDAFSNAQLPLRTPLTGRHEARLSRNAVMSPAEFCLILIEEEAQLNEMITLLQQLYSNEVPPLIEDSFRPQMPCVARMASNDSWQRAEIRHVGDEDVSLVFVDFGVTQFCPASSVKPMWVEFGSIPPFAIPAVLYRLEKTELWLSKIQRFKDVLKDINFKVVAEFMGEAVDSPQQEVILMNAKLSDLFTQHFCYIRRGREQWDYSVVASNRRKEEKNKSSPYGSPSSAAADYFQKPTKSAKVLKQKKQRKVSSSEDDGEAGGVDTFYEEMFSSSTPVAATATKFINEVPPKPTEPLQFAPLLSASVSVESQLSVEGAVKGRGYIVELYATWGSVCSKDFATAVMLKPRWIRKYYTDDLTIGFKPGDTVKVEAIRVPLELMKTAEESPIADSYDFSSYGETEMVWAAVSMKLIESSRVESTVGTGVVTQLTRTYGLFSALPTPFRREDLGPIHFDRQSLLKIPKDLTERMGIDELFVRHQLVDFAAVKMDSSDGCKWQAISVAPHGELTEGLGIVCHFDPLKNFGFVAFLPKIGGGSEVEFMAAPEQTNRKKNWSRTADSRQNYPYNFGGHLVLMHRSSVQFPLPKYPAEIFNLQRPNFEEAESDGILPLTVHSVPDVVLTEPLWVGKLVRFRACREVGGKYWDWRATLIEVLTDVSVDVDMKISIRTWLERYASVEPHVKALVSECVKQSHTDDSLQADGSQGSFDQVLQMSTKPVEEILAARLAVLRAKIKGQSTIAADNDVWHKLLTDDRLFEAFATLSTECPGLLANLP